MKMPPGYEDLASAVTDVLSSYQLERHVKRARDERKNHLKKAVVLDPRIPGVMGPNQAEDDVPRGVRDGRTD